MKKICGFLCLSFLLMQGSKAQSPNVLTIRKYSSAHAGDIMHEFSDLLAIPNLAIVKEAYSRYSFYRHPQQAFPRWYMAK